MTALCSGNTALALQEVSEDNLSDKLGLSENAVKALQTEVWMNSLHSRFMDMEKKKSTLDEARVDLSETLAVLFQDALGSKV